MAEAGPWYLADTPERDSANDAFGHADIADNLLTMIRGAGAERLMIGLLGGFGVGKSTVIELLKQKLRSDTKLTVIRLSAERHEVGGFHRSLVFSFAEELVEAGVLKKEVAEEQLLGLEYSTSTAMSDFSSSPAARLARRFARVDARRTLAKIASWFAAVLGLAALACLIVWLAGGNVLSLISTGSASLLLGIATLGSIIQSLWQVAKPEKAIAGAFKPGTLTHSRPRVEAADEFERAFGRLAEQVKGRLVIAVDDIDRLSPSEVLAGLNSIRSFQLTCKAAKRPIFIVSADERVIATAIKTSEPGLAAVADDTDKTVMAYLNRLFLQRQYVPPHGLADIQGFARSLLQRSNHQGAVRLGGELNEVLTVLIHDRVEDPRHVVRLLNAFFGDLRLVLQREGREGIRSITRGEVSRHPKTLARMVALKVDFPRFYGQLQTDLDLLASVEKVVAGTAEEADETRLSEAGWDLESDDFESLSAYVGRTAGWVDPEVHLLPFIYLGQDEIDRDLGSKDARQARSLLANAQVADLKTLVKGLDAQRQSSLVRLMTESIGRMPQHELQNAVRTVVSVVDDISVADLPVLADAVAAALPRTRHVVLEYDKLATLALHGTQDHLRGLLFDRVLEPLEVENAKLVRDQMILRRRDELEGIGDPTRIRAYLEICIRSLGESSNAEAFEGWLLELSNEKHTDLSSLTAESLLEIISRTEDELDRAWLQSGLVHFSRVGSAESVSLLESIIPLMRRGLGGEIGEFLTGAAVALSVSDPGTVAKLPRALQDGLIVEKPSTIDEETHLQTETNAAILLKSSMELAPRYNSGKIPTARFASELIAALFAWRKEHYASSELGDAVQKILEVHPTAATAIAVEVSRTLSMPNDDWPEKAEKIIELILRNLESLADEAMVAIRDALNGRLQPDSDPVMRDQTLALLETTFSEQETTDLAEYFINDQLQHLVYSTPSQAQLATDVVTAIFGMTIVGPTMSQNLVQRYASMTAYSQAASAAVVAKAMCQIEWQDEASQTQATSILVSQRNYLDQDSLGLLIDHWAERRPSSVPLEFIPVLTEAMKIEGQSVSAIRRNNVLRLLSLVDPVDGAVIAAYCDIDGQAATELFAKHAELNIEFIGAFIPDFEAFGVKMLGVPAVLRAAYESNSVTYENQVLSLVDQQLARDASLSSPTWNALLSPLPEPVLSQIVSSLNQALNAAEADARASFTLVASIVSNERLGALLAPRVGKIMERWISQERNAELSAALAAIFMKDEACRKEILAAFGKNGPRRTNPNRGAYDAVRRVIDAV